MEGGKLCRLIGPRPPDPTIYHARVALPQKHHAQGRHNPHVPPMAHTDILRHHPTITCMISRVSVCGVCGVRCAVCGGVRRVPICHGWVLAMPMAMAGLISTLIRPP